MSSHDHPAEASPEWDTPDFCPFCGTELTDLGAGFVDHLEDAPTCRTRFESWRENVAEDVGGEWGG
ncbi:hypothetical protein VB773_15540 [Haloarculaceae archaeon H-GB2-1]|nr:hypothetical protein [Haloarculaceae archaeon H-GB1-1]MEA5387368.1 hypothetical protein [Haloarculaceae archaeon H-GB11]MEA5408839.1 hypothetical protein [Haloarculaceae archaeon H-GB2-1]